MRSSLPMVLAGFALAQLAPTGFAQSTLQKLDLAPQVIPNSSTPRGGALQGQTSFTNPKTGPMVAFNGEFYFTADTPATGRELFRTNGLVGGTHLVHDFTPGAGGSYFGEMVVAGGRLYVVASNLGGGLELWSTGGTSATTQLEADLAVGSGSSTPRWLTVVGSKLFFAADTTALGEELVVIDTAAGGTVQIIDVYPGSIESRARYIVPHPNGTGVLFEAQTPGPLGREMWESDGTVAGTVPVLDLIPGGGFGKFERPVAVPGGVFFTGQNGIDGLEPYFTDGTAAGTVALGDLSPGVSTSESTFYAESVHGGAIYFSAKSQATGRELYRSDGTLAGTTLIADGIPGPASSSPVPLGVAGGKLIVSAELDPATVGTELYTLEAGGLVLLKDLSPGFTGAAPNSSYPISVVGLGNELVLGMVSGPSGAELWKTDGSVAGTSLLAVQAKTKPEAPSGLTAFSPTEILFAGADTLVGGELFRAGLTPGSISVVADINTAVTPVGSNPVARSVNGDELLISLSISTPGSSSYQIGWWDPLSGYQGLADGAPLFVDNQTWAGDRAESLVTLVQPAVGLDIFGLTGSAAETSKFADLAVDLDYGHRAIASDGSTTFFIGYNAVSGSELWVTDGTGVGTHQVADIHPGPDGGMSLFDSLGEFLGDELLFEASDGVVASALWKTDGTAAGTQLVKAINPLGNSDIGESVIWGDRLLFAADDGVHGAELWTTDGTTAGTYLVKDLAVGVAGSKPAYFREMGGELYFLGEDSSMPGRRLWKTDGTAAGTQVVTIVDPGLFSVVFLTATADRLYFPHFEPATGVELWSFDGTTTSIVADIFAGGAFGNPQGAVACGNRVYFQATTAATGAELFVSDGTAAGTHLAVDVNPGPLSGKPTWLVMSGGDLFFSATGADNDRELYRLTQAGPHAQDLGFGGSGARLDATPPVLGQALTATIEDAPMGDLGVLLMSGAVHPNAAFTDFGNASWIDPLNFKILGMSAAQTWSFQANVPSAPALIGVALNLQGWFLDPATSGLTTSNGMRLEFGL